MHGLSRQSFPWRRALLRLITVTMIVPALLFSFGSLMATTAQAAPAASVRSIIPGHMIPALKGLAPTNASSVNRELHLSISLNLRNRATLDKLIQAQSDPHSSLYHQYLTSQQFTHMFSPTAASINHVVAYLHGQGLHIDSVASNGVLIDASGSLSTVQRAFGVTISDYSLHGRSVYAPANEPSVPNSLAGLVLNISGLDNVAQYHHATTQIKTADPSGGFAPSDLRTAYDMNPLLSSVNGAGQTVGIFELDGYIPNDITTYLNNNNLGSAKFSNVFVDGTTNTAGAGAIEVELDMEVVSAITPGASQKIYIGPNSTSGVNDTYNRIVTDNTAKVVSTSWGECEAVSGNSELSALDSIFAQGAAQGQTIFAAAGDSGAFDCNNNNLAVDSPADDPHVVGVGGTNLQVGAGSVYGSESVWSNPADTQRSANGSGGGGGLSTFFAKPSFQTGPGVDSNTMRHVPDVSADADPASGYAVFCTASAAGCPTTGNIVVGGTSAAAPLWAGIASDTNAFLVSQGKSVLGNVNAELYTLFNTTQSFTAYHDITVGNNLSFNATAGYDLASGIGTPDVWNFARDAAGVTSGGSNNFSISPNPSSLSIAQGSHSTSTISTSVTSGSAATVSLKASVSPAGPTAALSPTSVTAGGSSTLTVSVGSTVAAGSYTVTITGTEGSVTQSTSVAVAVTAVGGGGGNSGNLVVNPGFENGDAPWVETSAGGFEIITMDDPHTGASSAFLCGYDNCNDTIRQSITLPSSFTTATFSYWLAISTNETTTRTCFDNFHAVLRTSSGATIATVQTQCNLNVRGFTQFTFNVSSALSTHKGQTIQVFFQGTTDSSLPTNFFVDDVSLQTS
ncbi:MAG: S53 family peptidase [Ktedonobacteraceae bacterium]